MHRLDDAGRLHTRTEPVRTLAVGMTGARMTARCAASTPPRWRRPGSTPPRCERVVRRALEEDLALGPDVTTDSTVPAGAQATGDVVPRSPGVLAGVAGRRGGLRPRRRRGGRGRPARRRRRPPPGRASAVLDRRRADPRAAHRRADRAEPDRPPVGHRHADPAAGSTPSPAPAPRSATPARPPRACARWRSTPCAAAAGSTTGWRSATPPWSRTTTSPRPAASPRRSSAVRAHAPDDPARGRVRHPRPGARGDRRPASSWSCSTTSRWTTPATAVDAGARHRRAGWRPAAG